MEHVYGLEQSYFQSNGEICNFVILLNWSTLTKTFKFYINFKEIDWLTEGGRVGKHSSVGSVSDSEREVQRFKSCVVPFFFYQYLCNIAIALIWSKIAIEDSFSSPESWNNYTV